MIVHWHENKTYSLGGSEAVSFPDIARILVDIKGQPVPFNSITTEEYLEGIVAKGVPHQVAEFITSWVIAMEEGEFEYQSGDLERLLGRKTKTFRSYIESTLA